MSSRYLVVANQTLGGHALTATVAARAREGAQIHVVVPATEPAADRGARAGSTAGDNAQRRLDAELQRCQDAGISASGEVGASDPLEAIRGALGENHYVGLIISTLPAGMSRWLHRDLPHQAVRQFGLPVEWVEARDDDDEPSTVHIAMPHSATQAMRNPRISRNDLPPMTQ